MSYMPGFHGFSKASGHAELWEETDPKKLEQSGWRTGTNESAYTADTLIGNWNEQRFDVAYISKRRSLPSQVRPLKMPSAPITTCADWGVNAVQPLL